MDLLFVLFVPCIKGVVIPGETVRSSHIPSFSQPLARSDFLLPGSAAAIKYFTIAWGLEEVIQNLRDLKSTFACLRCPSAFGLSPGEAYFGKCPFLLMCRKCLLRGSRHSFFSLVLGFWLGLDVSRMPSCSNKGSSGHDQSKTVGTEGRLCEREVPSEFRHVPGWVAAGQGLQFWI